MSSYRPAKLHDLPGAYRVCLLTGDSGRDATAIYRDPDLLGHLFVGPYIVGEPDLAWVLTDAEGVGGYVLATADTRAFQAWAEANWWPQLRERYPEAPDDGPDAALIRLIHAPPRAPDSLVAAHPAHLHIDLAQRIRGQGHGRAMIDLILDGLRKRACPGVHLDVSAENPNAIAFYRHLGFIELERGGESILMGLKL